MGLEELCEDKKEDGNWRMKGTESTDRLTNLKMKG